MKNFLFLVFGFLGLSFNAFAQSNPTANCTGPSAQQRVCIFNKVSGSGAMYGLQISGYSAPSNSLQSGQCYCSPLTNAPITMASNYQFMTDNSTCTLGSVPGKQYWVVSKDSNQTTVTKTKAFCVPNNASQAPMDVLINVNKPLPTPTSHMDLTQYFSFPGATHYSNSTTSQR